MLLANAVALLHAAAVLFMLTGSLLALRWPRLIRVHAPVALAILVVNLAGAACPLTTLELALRGQDYSGGFLGHYLFEPLGLDVAATGTQLGIHTVAFGLNAVGYALLVGAITRRSRRVGPGGSRDGVTQRLHATGGG